MNKNTTVAATCGSAVAVVFGIVGCSSGQNASVSGNRDDVKHKSATSRLATRPTYRTDCGLSSVAFVVKKPSPSRPKAPKSNKAPRSNKISSCRKVKTGVESYRQQVSADKWCVELDNVNGNKSADDRWFTVTQATYAKWAAKNEGDRVVRMKYLNTGC